MKNEPTLAGRFAGEKLGGLRRPLVPGFDYRSERPWRAAGPSTHRPIDDAVVELRAMELRGELAGLSTDRLDSIRAALYFVCVAARVDARRCLRAVQKGMTEWRTNSVVKLQMLELFEALGGAVGSAVPVDRD